MSEAFDYPQFLQIRSGDSRCRRVALARSQRGWRIGIAKHLRQLRKELVADGGELVLASRTLVDQFIPVSHEPFELRSRLRRGQGPTRECTAVHELHPFLQLVVEVVGQVQR